MGSFVYVLVIIATIIGLRGTGVSIDVEPIATFKSQEACKQAGAKSIIELRKVESRNNIVIISYTCLKRQP